jgi:hypothetical protein
MRAGNTDTLLFIHKTKYRFAIIPLALVAGGFVLDSALHVSWSRWITLAGLVGYVVVQMAFRLRRPCPAQHDHPVVLSPLYGRVTAVDGNQITITKGLFHPADVCASLAQFATVGMHVTTQSDEEQGVLIGAAPGRVVISCTIPAGFSIVVQPGAAVKAAETVLATQDAVATPAGQ